MEEIEKILNDFLAQYKNNLTQAGYSGNLADTAKINVNVNNNVYTIGINMEDYFQYAENGRGPGKMPPIENIKKWISVKPVLPTPMKNGKLPTENQLAFLIARKIGKEGTKGNHLFEKTSTEFDLINKIYNAVADILIKKINI